LREKTLYFSAGKTILIPKITPPVSNKKFSLLKFSTFAFTFKTEEQSKRQAPEEGVGIKKSKHNKTSVSLFYYLRGPIYKEDDGRQVHNPKAPLTLTLKVGYTIGVPHRGARRKTWKR